MSSYVCSKCGHVEQIFGNGGGDKLSSDYNIDFLGSVPLSKMVCDQTDIGKPTVIADSKSIITSIFKKIASKVAISVAEKNKDNSNKFPKIVIKND